MQTLQNIKEKYVDTSWLQSWRSSFLEINLNNLKSQWLCPLLGHIGIAPIQLASLTVLYKKNVRQLGIGFVSKSIFSLNTLKMEGWQNWLIFCLMDQFYPHLCGQLSSPTHSNHRGGSVCHMKLKGVPFTGTLTLELHLLPACIKHLSENLEWILLDTNVQHCTIAEPVFGDKTKNFNVIKDYICANLTLKCKFNSLCANQHHANEACSK